MKTETASTSPYSLPDPLRRAFTGVVRDGKILLIGGISQGASHFHLLHLVTSFDPEAGTFTNLAPLPFGTFAPGAGVIGKKVYIFGGGLFTSDGSFTYVNHILSLSANGRAWMHTGRYLSQDKGFPMVVQIGLKQLGILGGQSYDANGVDTPVTTFETFGM
jgi:hypothetical protein